MSSLFSNIIKIAAVTSVIALAGCKSDEEKRSDAAQALWDDLDAVYSDYNDGINNDDGHATAATVVQFEQLLLDFDEAHLGNQMCTVIDRFTCSIRLVANSDDPILVKFAQAYGAAQRMRIKTQTYYPDELAALWTAPPAVDDRAQMPRSAGTDGSELLPPTSN